MNTDYIDYNICISSFTGTALFFKSKVTYVRSDDNEYDIQFEDGTVYTLKAKEVRKTVKVAASKTERRRSRSRGRSPARKTAESPEGKNFEKSYIIIYFSYKMPTYKF